MQIAPTGTPGTGKTSVAERLAVTHEFSVSHLNRIIREAGLTVGTDTSRQSLIADFDAIRAHLQPWSGIIESHLAHHLSAEKVIVLRCAPEELTQRLAARGESSETIAENAESEALDIILSEAVDKHGRSSVWEVDTTGRSVENVVRDVEAILQDTCEPTVGTVDFTGYL